jgi:uncharacterized protein (TIGR02597 family)
VYRLLAGAAVASDPAGFQKLTFLGNSDTIASMPFTRPAAASGTVSSVSENLVTALGAPGWATNQFVYAAGTQSNTYYLRFYSGTNEGRFFPITANTTNTLTLNLGGDSLSGVASNDLFSVVPYWTLGTAFPYGKGVFPSTSIFDIKGEILIPAYTNTGINLSAGATYYFLTNTSTGAAAWRLIGSSSTNRNDDVLQPHVYMIIRNLVATNVTFTSLGGVIMTKISFPLAVNSTDQQDSTVALARPLAVSLDDSGLISSGAFTPTTTIFFLKDQIFCYDDSATNFNKSAFGTYYYMNSGWRKIGLSSSINVGTSNVFAPGTGVTIRKVSGSSSPIWLNTPTY